MVPIFVRSVPCPDCVLCYELKTNSNFLFRLLYVNFRKRRRRRRVLSPLTPRRSPTPSPLAPRRSPTPSPTRKPPFLWIPSRRRHTNKNQSKQSIITNRINTQRIIQKHKLKIASTRHKQINNKITIKHVGVGEGPFIDDARCSAS